MLLSLIFALISILFLVLGWLIWKKERIELLQEYHRNRVSEEDKKRFCTLCGQGVCAIGAGMIISAVWFAFAQSLWGFAPFMAGFLVGIGMLIRTIKTYNR